jgi:ParB-like nuclease domain
MNDYEPLNIAHYTPPATPLRDGPIPSLDWIAVNRLMIDKTYQRNVSRAGSANIARIAEYFEWSKFSPVIIAPIEGGMFSIIDGQHRATAALLRGIERVPCQMVHIDRSSQAEAFAAINGNTTRVTPQVVYYARLTGKDPTAEEMSRVLSAAGVTVARGSRTLRDMKAGETGAVGALFKFLKKFGSETLIAALQCVTETGSGNPGFLRATVIEPLCIVLHRNPKWRDAGERLFRAMDSFHFIEAWDAATKGRKTVPSVTVQMLLADAITSHLSVTMSNKLKVV